VKLISWNVAGRTQLHAEQVAALVRQEPDLVCLQEIRPSTREPWAAALRACGLEHALDSARFRNHRRLYNLTASRWPLSELPAVGAPFPERVLSIASETPHGRLELHNVHVPPAQSRGFVKVETCEAIYVALARESAGHRVLCGDFNTPREETPQGEVITFAANHPEWLQRWDAAERSIVSGLGAWDLADAFRGLNGYERQDVSWVFHTRFRRKAGFRLDHVLASASLRAVYCDYQHGWREQGLSDHSAIETIFEPEAL
jgi:exodeoxyribonuclease III